MGARKKRSILREGHLKEEDFRVFLDFAPNFGKVFFFLNYYFAHLFLRTLSHCCLHVKSFTYVHFKKQDNQEEKQHVDHLAEGSAEASLAARGTQTLDADHLEGLHFSSTGLMR